MIVTIKPSFSNQIFLSLIIPLTAARPNFNFKNSIAYILPYPSSITLQLY